MAKREDSRSGVSAKSIWGSIGGFLAGVAALLTILQYLGITHFPGFYQASENTTSSSTSNSTSTTIPKLLYSANWSNGLNGWVPDASANTSWGVSGGTLTNDGSSCCVIIAPFQPPTTNYALEAKIQMLSCSNLGGSVTAQGVVVGRSYSHP